MKGEKIAESFVDADLLIIGGGVAGCVAALKAVESGIEKVVLWEKAGWPSFRGGIHTRWITRPCPAAHWC